MAGVTAETAGATVGDRSSEPSLAELVRTARRAVLLTQQGLAERTGLSLRTIQEIEGGRVRRPHRQSVRRLADALGLDGPARAEFERVARRWT